MGRYNFTPLRVRQTAKNLFETRRIPNLPPWYETIGTYPPGETLARPVQRSPKLHGRTKKASRIFQPLPIHYPEDQLRQDFFGDHPWELAQPRMVIEDSGNDSKHYDWSKITQPGKKLDGESVVQRQMWLMRNKGFSKAMAYDEARREFYRYRHLEDMRRRIAREEALHVGAYFGKGPIEVGMEVENKSFESWKAWATQQIDENQQLRAQMFSGAEDANESEPSAAELEDGADEGQADVPTSR
ncbi:37S ribosomal protein Rsm25 [Dendryphion nanum]|uniref:37S ribosomal protein S25, mitochondrial n=1 Tax=Dendryphion nanum TaxID=256645 RepID=A0A9P9IK29_9PLEO|nr:37S ribosomal protein Rsm25 [Dendryphion nanum]